MEETALSMQTFFIFRKKNYLQRVVSTILKSAELFFNFTQKNRVWNMKRTFGKNLKEIKA